MVDDERDIRLAEMGHKLMRMGQLPPAEQQAGFRTGVPGVYLLLLCDVCRDFGLRDADLLEGLGISRVMLCQPDSQISMLTAYTAAQRAIRKLSDKGLGLAYARAFRATLMGPVGLLALSSPSVLAALDAVIRFTALRTPFLTAAFEETEDRVAVHVRCDLPVSRGVIQFSMEAMLVGLANVLEQMCGKRIPGLRIHMACPEPPYFRRYRDDLPAPVIFDADSWSLEGDRDTFLGVPLLSNPSMEVYAREQCEQEFMQLYGSHTGIAERIRDHLSRCESGEALPSLEQFADWLGVSTRTLKRRLRSEGVSFRELVDEELYSRARRLLSRSRLSIAEVGYQLGYHEAASFSRAFSRWAGMSPRSYRNQLTHDVPHAEAERFRP